MVNPYPIDGDFVRGLGYGLIFSAVCWLLIYGAAMGLAALVQWVALILGRAL